MQCHDFVMWDTVGDFLTYYSFFGGETVRELEKLEADGETVHSKTHSLNILFLKRTYFLSFQVRDVLRLIHDTFTSKYIHVTPL